MTDTHVAVLTPAGTGAIAVVRVSGPRAWAAVSDHFRPAKGTLPHVPPPHRVFFGTLGDGGDEVLVAVKGPDEIEVHCHGGRRVVRWIVNELEAGLPRPGGERDRSALPSGSRQTGHPAIGPLLHASTVRAAGVWLDQLHGAFDRAFADPANLPRLRALVPFARRLLNPPRVAVAGPPNVGKSSLVNALAGYQRSIVSPTAGTTRDVVSVELAFDGWPVRVTDTAGLRESGEALEAAGVELAERELASADLVLWVMDNTDPNPTFPPNDFGGRLLLVLNKCDLPNRWRASEGVGGMSEVSAETGEGVPGLVTEIVHRLFPVVPHPGEGVPYSEVLCAAVEG